MLTPTARTGVLVHLDESVRDFEQFLVSAKNVSSATLECYSRHVKAFLASVAGPGGVVDFGELAGMQIRSYVTGLSVRYAPQSLKLMATSIRCFLRFAWLSGWTDSDLADSVGTVVTHRFGQLPKALSAGELGRLLAVPDRRRVVGSRDYALMVVMSRWGLRAGEAAGMQLDDLDWSRGQAAIRVKGGGMLRLPIPHDVGQALVEYLQRRPAALGRQVFLTVHGVLRPMTRGAVTAVVAKHAEAAGLGLVHAHRLRHTAARAVLDGGGTLTEVGELLGHSTAQITMMYSSFDAEALRPLARPWPEAGGRDA